MGLLRSTHKEKSLPLDLWGDAMSTCVFVFNKSLTE